MSWPIVNLPLNGDIDPATWEEFCADIMEQGATGIVEEEEDASGARLARISFEPCDLGETDRLAEVARLTRETAGRYLGSDIGGLSAELVEDTGWVTAWRQFYRPIPITPTLIVGPADDPIRDEATNSVYVAIEPGSAFGTGTHETTRLSLQLMEQEIRSARVETLLDLGTGSGILSIAGVMLGCAWAVGVERDSLAEENFRANAALNGVEGRAWFVLGSTVDEAMTALQAQGLSVPGLVLCNMLSEHFDPLLADIRALDRPMILSGFLRQEEYVIEDRLRETGWRIERKEWIAEWGGWLCRPKAD